MKKLQTGIAALIILCLFAGCKGNPLPSGMDETELIDAGQNLVALLVDGEYGAVADEFRPDVRQSIDAEMVAALMSAATEKAGDYRRVDSTLATGQTDEQSGEDYGVAVILCDHRKKSVLYRLAFDVEMSLIGLSIEVK